MEPEEKWIVKVLDICGNLYSQTCTKCEEAYGDPTQLPCTGFPECSSGIVSNYSVIT